MAVSISEIKEKLKEAGNKGSEESLRLFIAEFEGDERAGVKKLILSAEKQISDLEAERKRMYEMFSFERKYASCQYICGIDEVGRGPLAGPVVAAAVILPKDCDILYINDSKQLSPKKREELSQIIKKQAVSYAFGYRDQSRIDEINILNATLEAMKDAVNNLSIIPDILLNDAVTVPGVDIEQVPIIKGDAKSASIAAASIIAKVERDHFMEKMDGVYPGYGFSGNKGYGSKEHIDAIKRLGLSPIHRRSFTANFV